MAKIRPIVIYPFRHRAENVPHLNALFLSLADRQRTAEEYERPVTVVNRQTYHRNANDPSFATMYRALRTHSELVVDAWCVDTCQMWLAGFGAAFDGSLQRDRPNDDIFWLVPGDFEYATENGKRVLSQMYAIPEAVTQSDFCIGQLELQRNSSKNLIDTYGTYGLLFNWFPAEAAAMRKSNIIRPRSEFFAIHHRFLRGALVDHRWFAYEQTIALLLQAGGRDVSTVSLGEIADESESRDNLTGALQQIERTERVLKVAWRDQQIRSKVKDWVKEFRVLEEQSKEIIGAAMTILESSL